MSVTVDSGNRIPHGLRGYRKPYNCRCAVCKAANAEYQRGRYQERKQAERDDEVAAQREKRKTKRTTKGTASTESGDSMGDMEKAVAAECAGLELASKRPTLVIAARNLAKIIDTPDMSSIHTSTTKQIMAIMAELRGETDGRKATGKRKSGSRLATVGALTKVKRQGA